MHQTATSIEQTSIQSQWTNATGNAVALQLPIQYLPYTEVFSREKQFSLLEYGPYDMQINLEPGTEPPVASLYPLSKHELDLLQEYFEEITCTRKTRPNSKATGEPILFTK